jgi:hypothetical protein
VEVEEIVGSQHVIEDPKGLAVYVPVDVEAQDFCFCSALAPDLADWLMRDPLTNIKDNFDAGIIPTLNSVLVAELCTLDRILDHQGIMKVSIPCMEVLITEKVATAQLSNLRSSNGQPAHTTSSPHRLLSNYSETSKEVPRTPVMRAQISSSAASSPEQEPYESNETTRQTFVTPPSLSRAIVPEDAGYRTLLDRVLRAARVKAFPVKDDLDMSTLRTALQKLRCHNDFGGFVGGSLWNSLNRLERDKRIGAAGELYVHHNQTLTFGVPSADCSRLHRFS